MVQFVDTSQVEDEKEKDKIVPYLRPSHSERKSNQVTFLLLLDTRDLVLGKFTEHSGLYNDFEQQTKED